MKKSFISLLEENITGRYIESLPNNSITTDISKVLNEENILQAENRLIELLKKINFDEIKNYANPFYIGFGNPNSDILVIGKEKAFDTSNLNLLVKESINNYNQWTSINLNSFNSNQVELCDQLGFNPLLPKSYHRGKSKRNHTWSITSIIINGIYNNEELHTDEDTILKNSFFNKCFLTELNYIPAKYHEGSGLQSNRASFLKHDFYKSFPIVIFSAKSYIGTNKNMLLDLFGADYIETITLDTIGSKRIRNITLDIYKSDQQIILVCNQLSGASGWSNLSLEKFSEIIKEKLNRL